MVMFDGLDEDHELEVIRDYYIMIDDVGEASSNRFDHLSRIGSWEVTLKSTRVVVVVEFDINLSNRKSKALKLVQ
jgi:hypothetical protein